jgi:Eco57I restriction-modification methylase
MQPLEKSLRNKLEKTIKDARDIAEDAARAALEQLGVGEPTPYPHLTEADRKLRRKLRAHGRQLGNGRNAKGEQALDRLIEEVAYEHWHRMLFARFLAENNLLMYPDPDDPVAVTLEECEDLAADEGASNGWELASRYAARMLPQIFRPDSPVFQLTLPPEHQQKLERLIADLPQGVFTASDSLGWVYQFWQAKKKDEINASEVKIGERELPAVTQFFTEPYMVSFLLDNSLGAWWAARRLTEADLKNAKTEDELRQKASLPGVSLDYLRFVQQEDGTWRPAAGTFDGWPEKLAELKMLDPCCGSGHFLVAVFLMLVPMRMELEELSVREAVDRVLSENIHGLELDQRCVELAAFALALAAWTYPGADGYRPLPELNVACSGLAISAKKKEWLALAGDNTNLRLALEELYKQFKDAPVLGSLINPEASLGRGSLFELKWEDVGPLLTNVLSGEKNDEKSEMGLVAKGLFRAANLLADKYSFIFTNPPYLTRGTHDERLKTYCENNYSDSKNDLATVFLQRCLELCRPSSCASMVLPQNWLFLTSYISFRKRLLKQMKWNMLARLGLSAFQTPLRVAPILLTIERTDQGVQTVPADSYFNALDVSYFPEISEKSEALKTLDMILRHQVSQLYNPDSRVLLSESSNLPFFSECAESSHGQGSFDNPRFTFKFWELNGFNDGWIRQQSSAKQTNLYDGCHYTFRWQNGRGDLWAMMEAKKRQGYTSGKWMAGTILFGTKGVLANQMGSMPTTLYLGSAFDENASVIAPKDEINLLPIVCFCSSSDFRELVREIDQELKVTCKSLIKIPFDLAHWQKVAKEKYPNGLPKPYSDDPTQWIFHGHPCGSVVWDEEKKRLEVASTLRAYSTVLQVAVARLLGYRWPAEVTRASSSGNISNPDQDGLATIELSDESRAWVKKSQELLLFADDDGIVCIPPVRGEMKAEDRLENLLAAAYGSEWSSNKKAELLAQAGHAGKTLETWLRDKFFAQHCKLFHHRPFIWYIWDGLHDGFAAMVNYHKLDAKLLETLIYAYLGDWISRQKQGIGNGVDGAQEKLAAAEALKKKLELILEGEGYPDKENPEKSYGYDIFVRWKSIEKQSIGWNPDLNDGVRLNIRPFMTVGDVKKKGAGILRDKPNIKWTKDRGKDVASAPWYHLGPIHGGNEGDRINDYHLGLEEKLTARQQQEKDGQK